MKGLCFSGDPCFYYLEAFGAYASRLALGLKLAKLLKGSSLRHGLHLPK